MGFGQLRGLYGITILSSSTSSESNVFVDVVPAVRLDIKSGTDIRSPPGR